MNQIINMITRMLTQRAVNWGINKASRRIGTQTAKGAQGKDRARVAQDTAKRSRQAINILRRLGR